VIVALAVVVAIQSAALWWRRTHPNLVLLVIAVLEVASVLISSSREASGLGLAFAIYAVSVYDRSRVRLFVAAAAIAVILAAVIFLVLGQFETARIFIPAGALSLVAWVIGDYFRSRRAFFAALVARHQQAREQAAEEERLRIARELHDVVAHNVSVMAIQAGAARVSGSGGAEALQSIETTARDTLAELNRLLGVLRKDGGAPDLSPQPGLDQVDVLLKPLRDAGMEATVKITGDRRPLPAALELSAYRIVQEAITNVLKHANASRVEVVIEYGPDALGLTISDNGSGAKETAASAGHGLIGMRERVELFGGELGAVSSSLGGFTVRAKLPTQ
ncbi:MAG TPA: sensor histidine kinase, partial [Candidatus Dormibacteraeota bacterium]|nr:sensor histidine kinase [Candidatus Dormibacteraeota bacterium]